MVFILDLFILFSKAINADYREYMIRPITRPFSFRIYGNKLY